MVCGRSLLGKKLGAESRQLEAWHDVGDDHYVVAIDLAHIVETMWCVGDRDQRVGVGVIDVLVWQDSVQNRLDRGRRRGGIERVDT